MRTDYDHLRRVVAEMKQGVSATTRYSWLDLAQEVLRMRKELISLREEARSAAKFLETGPAAQRVFDALETTINQILGEHDA